MKRTQEPEPDIVCSSQILYLNFDQISLDALSAPAV